jgi:hypothetical protein
MKCSYETRTVVLVTRTVATTKMPRFTNAEYADMRFVCGFCYGNSLAALREYQRLYPDRRKPYRRVFDTVHRNLRERGTLMPHARAGRGRRNVRDEEGVLLSYTITHQPALGRFLLQQDDFLSMQYVVLCV